MAFKLEIQTDNVAFGHTKKGQAMEVVRILREVVVRLERDPEGNSGFIQAIFDVNGNNVGHFLFEPVDPVQEDSDYWAKRARREKRSC